MPLKPDCEMPAALAGHPPSRAVQIQIRAMARLASRKESSLHKKTLRFAKSLRYAHFRPQSLLSLYSKKTQQQMLIPLAQITCKIEKKCELYAALSNYCKLENKTVVLNKIPRKDYLALSHEMQATPEGYFFYKNIPVGITKYARAKGLVDDEATAKDFFSLHDKKAMLAWIRDGFDR